MTQGPDEESPKLSEEQSSDALAQEILEDIQEQPSKVKAKGKPWWLIVLLVVVLSIGGLFVWLQNADLSMPVSKLLDAQINQNLNGKLRFTGFKLDLYQKHSPQLHFDDLSLYDASANLILQATNLDLILSSRNLLRSTFFFKSIRASSIKFNAVRETDFRWNFEKLVKVKKKRFKYKFGQIDLGDIDLHISDVPNNAQVDYANIRLNFMPKNHGYNLDLETLVEDKQNNYIKISGDIRGTSLDQFLDKKSNIDLIFNNIDATTIGLISGLVVNDSKSIIRKMLDKYGSKSTLSVTAKLDSIKDKEKNLRVHASLQNIADVSGLVFEAEAFLARDLQIKHAKLTLDKAILDLQGSIADWRKDNPGLALNLSFTNWNLVELVTRFPELGAYIPSFLLEIFNTLHGSDYMDGTFNFSATMKEPQILAKLKISNNAPGQPGVIINAQQEIVTKMSYTADQITVQEFRIPIDYSALVVNGNYRLKDHDFKIKVTTKDLPLAKLSPIAASIPFFKDYRESISQSTLSGYASMDLNITREQKQEATVQGSVKVAKLDYKISSYPLVFKNIVADLNINKDLITINHFQGYAYNPKYGEAKAKNYVEARGNFNLAKLGAYNLEIAAPKVDAQTLLDSGLLNLINKKFTIKQASGELTDIFANIKSSGDTKGYVVDGKMNVNNVSVKINDGLDLGNIKGGLGLNNGRIDFQAFNFTLNKNSSINLDGSVNKDLTQPNFKFKAKQLNFIEFINLFDPTYEKFKIKPLAGNLDADLEMRTKQLYGNLQFYNLGFEYSGSKYTKYPISKLNGSLVLNKDINLTNNSGKFGNTSFTNLNCKIENYQSKDVDRTINLSLDSELFYPELRDFIPSGISSIINAKGLVPAKLSMSGNKLKKNFAVTLDMNKLESFYFSNWLELNKKIDTKITSSFTVTPQLIISNDTKIVFSNKNATAPITSKLKAIFQVEDWSKKDAMKYYVSIKTPSEELSQDMSLIEPHILSLKPLNLRSGSGNFTCDTFGTLLDRQTICEFKVDTAVAQKYGIGDLLANNISVDLLSVINKPLEVQAKLASGNWNGIPYKNIKFDLSAEGDYVYIKDLRARVNQGVARAETTFNIKTLESTFKLRGQNLPAHELTQGIWGLGAEVPEGLLDGNFEGKTQGILPDPMFFNLVGTGNFIVKDGKLSQLVSMQRILTAVNTLENFDLNNIFQTLVTFKGGIFNYIISSLNYDHGKISSEKLLIKAPQIELNLSGYMDYAKDQQWIKGRGLIPKRSESILQSVGVGKVNLGNLVSMADLSEGGSKEKRFFDFTMIGPISDPKKSAESLRNNFSWE